MFAHKITFFSLILTAFFLISCSSKKIQSPIAPELHKPDPKELVIVATSDFHASLERAENLGKILRDLKSQYGQKMIHLDGGDLFQGSLEGNLNKGRAMVDFFNLVHLDAAAIGNHELDYGPEVLTRTSPLPHEDGIGNLKGRVKEAKFAWLSANLIFKNKSKRGAFKNALGQPTPFKPHAIFNRADQKVCVIGATTPTTTYITNPLFIRELEFKPLKEVVQAEAKFLRTKENCDLVLLTTHAGLDCKLESQEPGTTPAAHSCLEPSSIAEIYHLLNALPPGTLDAVVAGHTHLKAQEVIQGTPVIEAGSKGTVVGVLKIKKQAPPVFEPFISVPKQANTFAETTDITESLEKWRHAAQNLKTKPIGELSFDFHHQYTTEDPLGNLIVDAVLAAGKKVLNADFALINSGGIRGNLSKGMITYGDVFSVLPFDNALAIIEMTGRELKLALEIGLSGGHGLSPISGLLVKRNLPQKGTEGPWSRDLNHDGKKEDWERQVITEITDLKGEPLNLDKTYKLATMDFLVHGGDHLSIVYEAIPTSRKHFFSGVWVRDLLIEYLKSHPEIKPEDYFDSQNPRVVTQQ